MTFGLNSYIIVTVVNAIKSVNKKPTNFFDKASTIMNAALNSIQASMGNQHDKTNIQKQAYPPDFVRTIRAAYGITGTNFDTHTPYINGKRVGLDGALLNGTEIILIKNELDHREALIIAGKHQVLPMKTNSIIPSRLGEVLPPLERPSDIQFEVLGEGEIPGPLFGPGNAGQLGGFGDFGGAGVEQPPVVIPPQGPGLPPSAQGATGPTGPPGSQGFQGPAGPQGNAGSQGSAGPQGAIGPQGPAGPAGPSGDSALQAPIITRIDSKTGIVHFRNPSGMQVEVYKYTRKRAGTHSHKAPKGPYANRIGKRYKPIRQLPNGATNYTVQARWINAPFNTRRRNYFKLGVRNPSTGERSDLSIFTILTANAQDAISFGNKIMLEAPGGRRRNVV